MREGKCEFMMSPLPRGEAYFIPANFLIQLYFDSGLMRKFLEKTFFA